MTAESVLSYCLVLGYHWLGCLVLLTLSSCAVAFVGGRLELGQVYAEVFEDQFAEHLYGQPLVVRPGAIVEAWFHWLAEVRFAVTVKTLFR